MSLITPPKLAVIVPNAIQIIGSSSFDIPFSIPMIVKFLNLLCQTEIKTLLIGQVFSKQY